MRASKPVIMAAVGLISDLQDQELNRLRILSVLGCRPRAGWWRGKKGAGDQERRVYETVGKRSDYGDLNAAAGSLWKLQYRSQGTRGLTKAVAALRMAHWSVVGVG